MWGGLEGKSKGQYPGGAMRGEGVEKDALDGKVEGEGKDEEFLGCGKKRGKSEEEGRHAKEQIGSRQDGKMRNGMV